eukprot:SAG22_NODE_11743_length_471_cov_0.827957_1_plen_87_part_10
MVLSSVAAAGERWCGSLAVSIFKAERKLRFGAPHTTTPSFFDSSPTAWQKGRKEAKRAAAADRSAVSTQIWPANSLERVHATATKGR